MRSKKIILAAVGERGVRYGVRCGVGFIVGTYMPKQLLELVTTCSADSYDLTRGGAIAYFLESRRVAQLLQSFFARAESLRASMPRLGVGIAQEILVGQFDWLGKLKSDFRVDPVTERCVLNNIQGAQTYIEGIEGDGMTTR
ncbi:MAG: hypothetical protein U1F83_01035 [Verrucomicrobiota bacterium]